MMLKRFAAPLLLSVMPFFAQAAEPAPAFSDVSATQSANLAYSHISSYDFAVPDLELDAKLQQRVYCDTTGECIYTKLRLLIRKQESESWIICLSHNASLAEDYAEEKKLISEYYFSKRSPADESRYEDFLGYITLYPQWLTSGWRGPKNELFRGSPTKGWPLFWSATVNVNEDILIHLIDDCDMHDQDLASIIYDDTEGWNMIPPINTHTGSVEPNIYFLSDFLGANDEGLSRPAYIHRI